MNFSKLDFDSVKYRNHWYFLIGSDITSSIGTVKDPILKFQVITRLILKVKNL